MRLKGRAERPAFSFERVLPRAFSNYPASCPPLIRPSGTFSRKGEKVSGPSLSASGYPQAGTLRLDPRVLHLRCVVEVKSPRVEPEGDVRWMGTVHMNLSPTQNLASPVSSSRTSAGALVCPLPSGKTLPIYPV